MKRRITAHYETVIENTFAVNDITPTSIMLDLERQPKNAFEQKFPSAAVSGCFFHFQGVIYHVSDINLG